ncbi:NDP-sugar synthase [Chloroflexota bacterium]
MKAIILAAGPGTRLKPFTDALPKPMLPIGAKPLLEINVEYLKEWGFDEAVLAISHLRENIKHYFGDGKRFGIEITYSEEKSPLGTAGAVKKAEKYLSDDTFAVVLGDGLADINYQALLQYHRKTQATATMVVFEKRLEIPYGVLKIDVDKENTILALEEKPELTFGVNTGIVVLELKSLDYMVEDEFLRMTDLLLRLKENGEKVVAYHHKGNWVDIGQDIDQYLKVNRGILEGDITFSNTLTKIILEKEKR